jgi:hypothetical protein
MAIPPMTGEPTGAEPSVSLCAGGLGELPLMLWLIIKEGRQKVPPLPSPGIEKVACALRNYERHRSAQHKFI